MAAYVSEISITGDSPQEFIELAVTEGTDTSGYSIVHYDGTGIVYLTYSFGTIESTTNGFDVYTIDDSDPDFPVITDNGSGDASEMGNIYPDDAFALVDDTGSVVQFISFYGNNITATEGPANGMTSTMIGTPGFGQSLQSDNGGTSYYKQSSPNKDTIPYFEASTHILTHEGYRLASSLLLGDLVKTVDHGYQPIRWIKNYRSDLTGAILAKKPVCIAKGALGSNRPSRRLCLSPQHRVVLGTAHQVKHIGNGAVLAPAKSLTELPGISHMFRAKEVHYIHFAFDKHEVIWANGAEVETLFLSETVISSLPNLLRVGLRELAKNHQQRRGQRRAFLKVREAQQLIEEWKVRSKNQLCDAV